jgi:hypothetical protein
MRLLQTQHAQRRASHRATRNAECGRGLFAVPLAFVSEAGSSLTRASVVAPHAKHSIECIIDELLTQVLTHRIVAAPFSLRNPRGLPKPLDSLSVAALDTPRGSYSGITSEWAYGGSSPLGAYASLLHPLGLISRPCRGRRLTGRGARGGPSSSRSTHGPSHGSTSRFGRVTARAGFSGGCFALRRELDLSGLICGLALLQPSQGGEACGSYLPPAS